MFDKKPKQVTLHIGQTTTLGGYLFKYYGKSPCNDKVNVFSSDGWNTPTYVPDGCTFYTGGQKVKILESTSDSVTLGWNLDEQ
jgi:hypothetical protein